MRDAQSIKIMQTLLTQAARMKITFFSFLSLPVHICFHHCALTDKQSEKTNNTPENLTNKILKEIFFNFSKINLIKRRHCTFSAGGSSAVCVLRSRRIYLGGV